MGQRHAIGGKKKKEKKPPNISDGIGNFGNKHTGQRYYREKFLPRPSTVIFNNLHKPLSIDENSLRIGASNNRWGNYMQELVNGTHPCKYIESIFDKLEAVQARRGVLSR